MSSIELLRGDCLDLLPTLAADSIDSCVTDPPYGLAFMGRHWDHGVPGPDFWRAVCRVLKPGAHLAAFGGTRTYHRMACAIEDAGFEIRDSLCWLYGVGFPKSHNISGHETFCQCGAEQATERDVRPMRCDDVSSSEHAGAQCGQILQPSMSQQSTPAAGWSQPSDHGGVTQSSLEGWRDVPPPPGQLCAGEVRSVPARLAADGAQGRLRDGAPLGHCASDRSPADADGVRASFGSQAAAQRGDEPRTVAGQSFAQDGGAWENCGRCGKPMVPEGLGTALKPAFEPIVLARKPLSEGTVAANVLRWRTGALNIDGCRIPGWKPATTRGASSKASSMVGTLGAQGRIEDDGMGRWPANVVHDGSDEVVGAFPAQAGAAAPVRKRNGDKFRNAYGSFKGNIDEAGSTFRGDSGSAARFFYSAKASKADRAGSKHPTVKPISLKQWLARLITPPRGLVLDPFAGSGTTGAACRLEGFRSILIEREPEYWADIERRMAVPAQERLL